MSPTQKAIIIKGIKKCVQKSMVIVAVALNDNFGGRNMLRANVVFLTNLLIIQLLSPNRQPLL